MHRQSEPRAGNHQRHTRTRNVSLPTQANHTVRGARKQPPNWGATHAASEDTTHTSSAGLTRTLACLTITSLCNPTRLLHQYISLKRTLSTTPGPHCTGMEHQGAAQHADQIPTEKGALSTLCMPRPPQLQAAAGEGTTSGGWPAHGPSGAR